MTRVERARARRGERGIALPVAIAMAVVLLGIIIVITMQVLHSRDRAASASQDALAQNPADDGAATYLRALNARFVGEHDGFVLTAPEARTLLGTGVDVIDNTRLPASAGALRTVDTSAASGVPAPMRFTVRRQLNQGNYAYWQPFAMGRPDWRQPATSGGLSATTGSRVVLYVRGWVADANNTAPSSTRIIRVEYRPGRFADYFLLVDGQEIIGDGTTVNGPVHSNGLSDRLFGESVPAGEPMIRMAAGARCAAGARFSTTSGSIALGGCGAPSKTGTGRAINLKALNETVTWAWSLCGNRDATYTAPSFSMRCVTAPNAGGLGVVDLGSLSRAAQSTVLLVDGSVRVRGHVPSGRRVTVIAHSESGGIVGNAISIEGNVTHGADASVGLLAGGDVIIRESRGSCPVNLIQAALVATSGNVTYPTEWRIPVLTTAMVGGMPLCGSLTIQGSIASHYGPTLIVQRGSTPYIGWRTRNLVYDPALYHAPPPLVPLTTPWQHDGFDEASKRCFSASGTLTGGIGCR